MLRASDLESGLFPFWPSALSAFLGLYGQTLRYVSLRGLVPAGPHGCLGCGVVLGSGSMSLVSFARRAKRGEEPQARPCEFTESASACWGYLGISVFDLDVMISSAGSEAEDCHAIRNTQ